MIKYPYYLSIVLLLTACDSPRTEISDTNKTNSSSIISESAISPIALSKTDQHLLAILQDRQLTGDPSAKRQLPSIHSAKAQLGKQLFYYNRLSKHAKLACVNCHDPLQSGTTPFALATGLSQPQAVSTEPDYFFHRSNSLLPVRNAPTTFNIGLWDQALFHDGRVESLNKTPDRNGANDEITTPFVPYPKPDPKAGRNLVQAQAQLSMVRRSALVKRLTAKEQAASMCNIIVSEKIAAKDLVLDLPNDEKAQWLTAFRHSFTAPDGLPQTLFTQANISEALATYMRSQIFLQSPWKAYLEGQTDALSAEAKEGALLFFRPANQGGFNCAACHSGDTFTDEKFYHTLMPPIGLPRPFRAAPEEPDYGRWFITMQEEDKYRFRTPSLLNVSETGPWGHNGAWPTLTAAVRHMLNPWQAASQYNTASLSQYGLASDHLAESLGQMLRYNVDLPAQKYTEKEVRALVAFLYTLTDPCIKDAACMRPWQWDTLENVDNATPRIPADKPEPAQ